MLQTGRTTRVFHARREPSGRGRRASLVAAGAIVAGGVAFVVVQLLSPVPALHATSELPARLLVPADGWSLPFAPGPEQIVTVAGIGPIGSAGGNREIPIASVTKLMSALVVLHDHPLAAGDSGPSITITPADVAAYRRDLAAQDSVLAVTAGEQLSELQALEGALVPSADNVVDLLASWDAGSIPAFVAEMNAEAARLGLDRTRYAGASGVDPRSVSTAADQARLAAVALANPVIAGIVALPQVSLPVAGVQYNVDADLGKDGIDGVKTGWVPQGGASFVFAASDTVAGRNEKVIGAVVGDQATPALPSALDAAVALVHAADTGLVVRRVVVPGERIGTIVTGRGEPVPVVASAGASLVAWRGAFISERVRLERGLGTSVRRGERVGTLEVALGEERVVVPLVTTSALAAPSLWWRLGRV